MDQSHTLNLELKGKELEIEAIRYALYKAGVDSVFNEVDAIVRYNQVDEV